MTSNKSWGNFTEKTFKKELPKIIKRKGKDGNLTNPSKGAKHVRVGQVAPLNRGCGRWVQWRQREKILKG